MLPPPQCAAFSPGRPLVSCPLPTSFPSAANYGSTARASSSSVAKTTSAFTGSRPSPVMLLTGQVRGLPPRRKVKFIGLGRLRKLELLSRNLMQTGREEAKKWKDTSTTHFDF